MATKEGTSHLTRPLDEAGFERGLLVAVDAAGVMRAQMPASEMQTQVRSSRLGQ